MCCILMWFFIIFQHWTTKISLKDKNYCYLVLCFTVKSVMSILSILNLFKSQETSHDFYYVKPYIWLDGSLKMVFQGLDPRAKMIIVQKNSYLFTLFFKLIYLDKYSAFPVVFYTGLEAKSSIKRPRILE